MKKHIDDGTILVSGQDLANFKLVVDPTLVRDLGGAAARRVEAARLKKSGLTWSQARKAALSAEPTPQMLKVISERLGRGCNNMQAIDGAIAVAGMQEVK